MPAFLLKPFGVFPSHLEQDPELPMAWASLGHACRSLPLPPHQVPLSLHPKQSLQTPRAQYSGQPLLTGGPGELPVDPGGWEPWEAGCPTHGRPRGLRLVSGNVCRCGCEGGRGKEAKLVLSARSRVRLFRRRQTPPIPSHSPQGGPSHSPVGKGSSLRFRGSGGRGAGHGLPFPRGDSPLRLAPVSTPGRSRAAQPSAAQMDSGPRKRRHSCKYCRAHRGSAGRKEGSTAGPRTNSWEDNGLH